MAPRTELTAFAPELVIFDKGGTLIDFREMWSAWAVELARRLETVTGLPLAERLFEAMGFDARSRWIDPQGRLALDSMANLREMVVGLLGEAGLTPQASEEAVAAAWYAPDPVTDTQPLTDIPALFGALRERGAKIAIVTMDDRAPTEAVLAKVSAADLVDALVCADDGLPLKPAPEMVWAVCRATGVEPRRVAVVGDATTDMEMGRAAGVGLVVGVLSGVAPEELLAPWADVVVSSVAEMV
jgi:phosphoglycolate phosphatase-like HAD superfamily hydrolase